MVALRGGGQFLISEVPLYLDWIWGRLFQDLVHTLLLVDTLSKMPEVCMLSENQSLISTMNS